MSSNAKRYHGSVNWFHAEKGFGFIFVPELAEDVFVHYAQIDMDGYRTLKEGQRVTFEVVLGPKGKQANLVRAELKAE